MMNMLNAGMCVASAELSSDYVLWYVYASFMIGYASCYACCLSFNVSIFPVYVHGAVCPVACGVRHVLFAGPRDGDMTVWYQRSRLQQWASMGQEGATDRGSIPLCPAEIRL